MVSLQAPPRLDIFQYLIQYFHDLKQKASESTLWVCDSGMSQPFSLDLQETGTRLVSNVQFHPINLIKGSLDLQIAPETVLVSGKRLDFLEAKAGSEATLPTARFQSLIPLPRSIQPQTAIAQLSGTALTLTLMKAYETQRTAQLTVGDRAQLLPYAIAASTAAVPVAVELN